MFRDTASLVTGMVVAVLQTAGVAAAAEESPPWHVKDAEIRIPVTVAVTDALLRMPPQVYLADLDPVEMTDGLSFDSKHKCAIARDYRMPEEKAKLIAQGKEIFNKEGRPWDPNWYLSRNEQDGGPIWQLKGSATYALKPEYRWFSWRPGHAKVFFDDKLVADEDKLQPSSPHGLRGIGLVAIPPDAKTLKIEGEARYIMQPGFLTRAPAVAHAALRVADRDPTTLIPIVYRHSGERVGCRIVWAESGKPMSILFDASSGDQQYLVYLVDRAKNPQRLEFFPMAGLIHEARYLDRYDPEVETLSGFHNLWDNAPTRAGKTVTASHQIYTGHLPFGSSRGDVLDYISLVDATPPALSRFTGYFHVPATDHYRFYCRLATGGYILFDGQLASKFRGRASNTGFDIHLEQGLHRLDLYQYTHRGNGMGAGLWWLEPVSGPHGGRPGKQYFGNVHNHHDRPAYVVWEPMAKVTTGPIDWRDQGPIASFTWFHHGQMPAFDVARDLIWYRFVAKMPGVTDKPLPQNTAQTAASKQPEDPADKVIYRWQFGDGRPVEGEEVLQAFFTPGTRQVQLEILRGTDEKVIGRTVGKVHVQVNLASPGPIDWEHAVPRRQAIWDWAEWHLGEENASKHLSLDELVSLYFWSYPLHPVWNRLGDSPISISKVKDYWPERLRRLCADALARRVDELIDAYPYNRLLQVGQSLARSQNGPVALHFDAAEKLLEVVMDRAPAGSDHWESAAMTLLDIYVSVRADPDKSRAIAAKLQHTERTVDMAVGWTKANAVRFHYLADTDNAADLTKGLTWSQADRPFEHSPPLILEFQGGRGVWLASEFHLPASWKGRELVLNAGTIYGNDVTAWFNDQPLGGLRQWPVRTIVVPAKFVRRGEKNRLTLLIQRRPQSHQVWTAAPAFSADLERWAWVTASFEHLGQIRIADKGQHRTLDRTPLSEVRSLAFSPDGQRLAVGDHRSRIKFRDVETGKELWKTGGRSLAVISLAISPDGKILASGSEDSRINLWDAANGNYLRTLTGHSSEVLSVAFSPDGKRLASASFDQTVKVWDTEAGHELLNIGGNAGSVNAVAFSHDGKTLASGIDDTQIAIWDASNGTRLRTFGGQPGEVTAIAFSPDGRRLATGSRERVAALWDLETGSKLATLGQHGDSVVGVQFSPDSKRLASWGGDHARFWNSDTGKEAGSIRGLRAHDGHVHQIHFCGLHTRAKNYENYPVELYTSESCKEVGMKYACYDGKWDKLPDFEALEAVKTGIVQRFDAEHLQNILLRWRVITDEGVIRWEIRPGGMKLIGYVKVKKAADYEFAIKSDDGSRLYVAGQLVIDNERAAANEAKRGTIRLEPGVYPVKVTFFHKDAQRQLAVTFPRQFVRDLSVTDVSKKRAVANALLLSETDAARRMLMDLERHRWPLDDRTYSQLINTFRSIRRWAARGRNEDVVGALEAIHSWQVKHPMLRTVPEFMIAEIDALVGAKDYVRAFTRVDQLNKLELSDGQRRHVMLMQVKWNVRAGRMDNARDAYKTLKTFAPTSIATAEAREAIKQAVLKRFENE